MERRNRRYIEMHLLVTEKALLNDIRQLVGELAFAGKQTCNEKPEPKLTNGAVVNSPNALSRSFSFGFH